MQYVGRKRVVYRKTKEGYAVRTPDGWTNFSHDSHAAKTFFRQMLQKFKQVYVPRAKRKGKSFELVMSLTGFVNE